VKFLGGITKTDWQRPSVIALVLANLVPVLGVFYFHWEVFPLMFLFWSENVIIGVFNVLRMLVAMFYKDRVLPGIPFFCVHYGGFVAAHGFLILELFGGGAKQYEEFFNPLDPGTYWQIFGQINGEYHLDWAILALAVSRGFSFVTNYLGRGEYRRITPNQLFWRPYGRILILHVALLVGGISLKASHSPAIGLVVLIVLKTAGDLIGHFIERRKFAENLAVKTG
jgi:hypothetical protein